MKVLINSVIKDQINSSNILFFIDEILIEEGEGGGDAEVEDVQPSSSPDPLPGSGGPVAEAEKTVCERKRICRERKGDCKTKCSKDEVSYKGGCKTEKCLCCIPGLFFLVSFVPTYF